MLRYVKQARAAISLLSPEEVRRRIERPVTFGLVAAGNGAYDEMMDFLVPPALPEAHRAGLASRVFRAGDADVPANVDLVLYQDGIPGPEGTYMFHGGDPVRTATEIVQENDDLALALARQYPAFRRVVVDRIVQSVSRENALFAITTALPNIIPSILQLPWAFGEFASDMAFLTANQVRMAFLVSAACGREIGFAEQKAEIVAIAAGGFGWRAIARELVGKIPLGGGLIPKGAVAYAATYAIGKGLEKIHCTGVPFTNGEKREIYREALERGRSEAKLLTPPPVAPGPGPLTPDPNVQ